jgi:orotate phosphoribosyltransferase-like protein
MNKSKAKKLREAGLTYQQIGERLGVSHTTVMLAISPQRRAYQKAYKKTDKYKAHKRHYHHLKINKKFNNCERCNEK